MKRQQGFTLIELIVVIVILGILSAIALPKFSALQVDARVAQLAAARGAVQAAAAIVHATALTRAGVADAAACTGGGIANNLVGATGTVCTESGRITMTFGYPAGSALGANPPGIISAAGLSSVFSPTQAQLNAEGYAATAVGGVTTIMVVGGSGTAAGGGGQINATCFFTYTEPGGAGSAPAISVPTITGC